MSDSCLPQSGWFLFQTRYHKESLVLTGLLRIGYESYCPVMSIASGEIPMFPQYIFAHINDFARFHEIKWLPGLKKLVQFNSNPNQKKK